MPVAIPLIAAGVGAAGAIGGSLIQSSAAKSAAKQQANAAQMALQQQQQMFGIAQKALNPYIDAGTGVLPTLQSLLTPSTAASTLQKLPGFQFQSQWGNLAATNQLAAMGLGGSAGPVGKALSDYNQGLAGTYWQNAVAGLQNYAGMGLQAGGALAGNAINSGNSQANTLQNQGNALAAGTLGGANALSGGLQAAASAPMNALLMSKLFGGNEQSGIYGPATQGLFPSG